MCAADGLALNSLCRIPPSPSSCPRDLLLKRLAACPSGSSQLAVACSPWVCGVFIFFSTFFFSYELVLETWSGSDCLDEAVAVVLAVHHACCLCTETWISGSPLLLRGGCGEWPLVPAPQHILVGASRSAGFPSRGVCCSALPLYRWVLLTGHLSPGSLRGD